MTFLITDGVVPSNEARGYILRRVMRRAIQQGRSIGLESPFLEGFADLVVESYGAVYPELEKEHDTIHEWLESEEESFGRTLDQGTRMLAELVEEARSDGTSWISAEDAFKLHDTYGFPYDLTRELLAEEGLSVDDAGFEELMEEQRERARMGIARAHGSEGQHERVMAFARAAGFQSRFVGYETTETSSTVAALQRDNGRVLAKFPESPFYPEGGGQISDAGIVETDSGRGRVEDVYRLGDDQAVALAVEQGELKEGERARLVVDRLARHATACNHTATHLLHAALREQLGHHVRQAGSAVRPDKLRFDFTHGAALAPDEVRSIEDRVNDWIKASRPVRAMHMARDEAEALGAIALFGEKYGDWVRVVEVEEVSRELCGGTHVANTSEVGIFAIVSEGSSAANVRRVEALTGPAAIDWFRARRDELAEAGSLLGSRRDAVAAARRAAERLEELERASAQSGSREVAERAKELEGRSTERGGIKVLAERVDLGDQRALLQLADRVKSSLGDAAVVLGGAVDGRVAPVASF